MLDSSLKTSAPIFPIEHVLGGSVESLAAAPVEELADRVARAASHHGLFAGLVEVESSRHVVRTLHRSPAVEVVLCCWLPGQGARPHDHGASRCVAAVVFGELVETRFRAEGDLAVPVSEVVLRAQATAIARPLEIHGLANRGRRPAVSLHLHVPAARLRAWRVG